MKLHYYLVVLLVISACNNSNQRNDAGVEAAMRQYDHLIKKMDADSIALLYTPEGQLGTIAYGRDSIRKFLASFKNFKVLSQTSTTTNIKTNDDSSLQKGTYKQTVVLPSGKDTVTVKGEYTAAWLWIENGWHINRMETKPVK